MKLKMISALITALIMSGSMSLLMAIVTGRLQIDLLAWLKAWGIGLCVAFPVSLFLPQKINKMLAIIIK